MTDLYSHFSQLLDKSAQERTDYIDAHIHDMDVRMMLERLLTHCEHMPGDTLFLAQMQTQQSDTSGLDVTQLQGLSIGPYRLSRRIGQGGMGVVYLAHRDDDRFEQRVGRNLGADGVGFKFALRNGADDAEVIARRL